MTWATSPAELGSWAAILAALVTDPQGTMRGRPLVEVVAIARCMPDSEGALVLVRLALELRAVPAHDAGDSAWSAWTNAKVDYAYMFDLAPDALAYRAKSCTNHPERAS